MVAQPIVQFGKVLRPSDQLPVHFASGAVARLGQQHKRSHPLVFALPVGRIHRGNEHAATVPRKCADELFTLALASHVQERTHTRVRRLLTGGQTQTRLYQWAVTLKTSEQAGRGCLWPPPSHSSSCFCFCRTSLRDLSVRRGSGSRLRPLRCHHSSAPSIRAGGASGGWCRGQRFRQSVQSRDRHNQLHQWSVACSLWP